MVCKKLRYHTLAFERPGFERLLEDVRGGRVNCIVVKDLSRFGRNYLETGNYLDRVFPLMGVRFVAITDRYDTLTADRADECYVVPLKNIINDAYSKDISRKIRPSIERMQKNGWFIGSWAPYGYRRCADDRHKIEPNEDTAPVVREIFAWRAAGDSYLEIARRLNQRGVMAPSKYLFEAGVLKSERYANVVWNQGVVKGILSNEVYLGHMIQGRCRSSARDGRKRQALPRSEWAVVRDTHLPLIDVRTFEAAKQLAQERRAAYYGGGTAGPRAVSENPFRGLLYCADCGHPLVRKKNVTCSGKHTYYTYICQTHSNLPSSCTRKNFHEEALLTIVRETLDREIAAAISTGRLLREYEKSGIHGQIERELTERERMAQKDLDKAELLYDGLYQSLVDGMVTKEEYLEQKELNRGEIDRAERALDDIRGRKRRLAAEEGNSRWLEAFCSRIGEGEATSEAIQTLIRRIEIDEDAHISISLRFRDEYLALSAVQMTSTEEVGT